MNREPAGHGGHKRRLRTLNLGVSAVGIVLVLFVIVAALAGCSVGAAATPVVAVETVSGSNTTAGSSTTTIASGATTISLLRPTTTIKAETTTETTTKTTTTTADASLELIILEVTSSVSPGSSATVKAKTAPGAHCSIVVIYASGESTAKGLEPKEADASGNVSWTWRVGRRTAGGEYPVRVTASMDGRSVTEGATFVVK